MKSSFVTVKTVRTDYNVLIVPNNLGDIISAKLREHKNNTEVREWLLESLEHCEQDVEIVKVGGFPAVYVQSGEAGFAGIWKKSGFEGIYLDYWSAEDENALGKTFLAAHEKKFFSERLGTINFGEERLVIFDPLDLSAAGLKARINLPEGKYVLEKGEHDGDDVCLKILRFKKMNSRDKTVSKKAKK
jgi:hypothetical protein